MRSGSTGFACLNINRKFIDYNISKEYFDIAKQRLENIKILKIRLESDT
jgi:DNA modification methylase